MKRTKERFGKFENYNDHNISSLKVFEGVDLGGRRIIKKIINLQKLIILKISLKIK